LNIEKSGVLPFLKKKNLIKTKGKSSKTP